MSSRCRVALLGVGTVGSAVACRLTAADPDASPDVQLTHIVDRRASQKRATLRADGMTWTSSARLRGGTIRQIAHAEYDHVTSALTADFRLQTSEFRLPTSR